MDAFLVALVWVIVYLLGIALACYIVCKGLTQLIPASASWVWAVWAIGALIWLILVVRLLLPVLA